MSASGGARIDTAEASLSVVSDAAGRCVWQHLGTRIGPGEIGGSLASQARATFALDNDPHVPLVPAHGLGWFGPAALELRGADGHPIVWSGGMATIEATEGSITVVAHDPACDVAVEWSAQALPGGALRIETTVTNRSGSPLLVSRLASASFPVPASCETIVSWRGHHAAEFVECMEPVPEHGWYRETRIGIPGHGGPPGFYLCPASTPWDEGLTMACQLAWSGDSRMTIERLADGGCLAMTEAVLQPGEVVLAPGERHAAPPAILATSAKGRNGAMAQQHAAVRALLDWPTGAMSPRPVHLNSWEACYFAHDEARIGELAEAAAAIGVERFVLDDGWFAGRVDDRRALGDWTPDPAKYPDGLAPLARKVNALGMQFGLWVEPEMVSPDSALYRAHPDWALAVPGHEGPLGRNQLVLDMRRNEVRDYLFDALDVLLRDAPIGYLKWDHNRAHAPSAGAAQVLGLYELLVRLRAAHPHVEIESCASGGGRCDAGIAPYVHRYWTSDNLDAVSRVAIQRGFVAFLPPEMMGAHVGASPAHATGRSQSLAFRAAVACMGHFGVELDPGRLSWTERAELAEWIAFYKQWRGVIHGGGLHLGDSPDGLVWQAHGDGEQWLLFAIRTEPLLDRRPRPITLPFARGSEWAVRLLRLAGVNRWLGTQPWEVGDAIEAQAQSGDWLASAGLPLPPMAGEAVAIFHLERA